MSRRLLFIGLVVSVIVTCLGWFFAASILWSVRGLLVGEDSPRGIEDSRFALLVYAITGINVIALIVFLIWRHGWGWLVLAAVQLGDLLFSFVEAVVRSTTWWAFSALAALALVLLYLHRSARGARI